MRSAFVFIVCLSCLNVIPSEAFEYNFQITHGGGQGGYEGRGRSSVHFKGSSHEVESSPVYKDEQAHASEGYQRGYSVAERESQQVQYAAAAHQYAVGQPDDKYKYAVANHEEEPQTELRYVSEEEAAKYHQTNRGQLVKYVPAEEAQKYQESAGYQIAPAEGAKYQNYPQSVKQSSYKSPVHQAQRYQSNYEPAPHRYEEYSPEQANKYASAGPLPQGERYVRYQQVQEHQPEPEHHHQPQHQQLQSPYQSSEKRYPESNPAVEQKIQYVQVGQEPQQQYEHQPAPVRYVHQYTPELKEDSQQGGSSGAAAEYQKQEYAQSPKYIYSYPPGAVQYAPRHHIAQPSSDEQEQPQHQPPQHQEPQHQEPQHHQQEYHHHQQQHQAAQQERERVYPQHFASRQKFELAEQYEAPPAKYTSDRVQVSRFSGVSQSASVPKPSYKQSAASADPELTRIASHGAAVYGHVHALRHSEAPSPSGTISGYAHSDALRAYQLSQQQAQYAAHTAVVSKASQHSFPHHLTHGIARGLQSPRSSPGHLQDYYVEKAKKKSS